MIKNVLIGFLCSLLLFSNFVSVFAEDEPIVDEPIVIDNTDNINNLRSDVDNLSDNIDNLNDSINDLSNLLSSSNSINVDYSVVGASNYDFLSESQLTYLYNHFSDSDYIVYNGTQKRIYFASVSSVTLNNNSLTVYKRTYSSIDFDGNVNNYPNPSSSTDLIPLSDWGTNKLFKLVNNNINSFELPLYRLYVSNYGLGSITYSIDSLYKNTNIVYKGLEVSISYNNSHNDFVGWYNSNNDSLVSDSVDYSFTINDDVYLSLNLNDSSDLIVNTNQILLCIFCFLALIMFKSMIWGV